MKRAIALILALLIVLALWVLLSRIGERVAPRPGTQAPARISSTDDSLRPSGALSSQPVNSAERSTLADELNAPSSDIHRDLRLVAEIMETFRTNFLQSGNPTGTNAEITAALSGHNKLRLALIPRDHAAINGDGELCDRWGTPFFFHAESSTRMEVRSAGPDRKMWTDDDVAFGAN